jgi:hypothetical protein
MALGLASGHYAAGVELLNETWGLPAYRLQSNSEYRSDYPGSQTTGDNLRGQKGNNPDRPLRSPIHAQCGRMSGLRDSGDVGLEAATI